VRDYKKITGIIADLESSFPVDSLAYAEIPLWPILRQEVAKFLFWEKPGAPLPWRPRMLRMVPAIPARVVRAAVLRKAAASFSGKAPTQADVLFVTAGFEYVTFAGKLYNKFLDPVKELLNKRGVRHIDLELGFEGKDYVPKHSPTVDLRKEIARVFRAAAFGTPGFTREQRSRLAAFAEHCDQRHRIPLDVQNVIGRASRISSLSAFFDNVLSVVQPKACLFVCYYQDSTMALAHASRRRRVKTVELQHSVVAEYDWNWCKWSVAHQNGYSILPDVFWTWGDKYSDMLDCWKQRPNTNLFPRVAGNLWIWKWREAGLAQIPEPTARLAGPDKTVLYTVGFGDVNLMLEWFPPELEEAIRRSPGWRWHVRLHYKADDALVRSVREHVAGLGANVEVHCASEHHLYHVFSIADVHISQTSTTTLEAEAFGVPNLIIGDIGRDWYSEEIASGAYGFAVTADAIIDFVNKPLRSVSAGAPAMVTDASRVEALLDEMNLIA
jgi:hypothetical protein